ncbi:hypothetical protein CYMTET_11733 [Cymbomonas tetramitiformis]|uniref:Aspartyl aminopeptidase n=1 Tax=Cymbomonas tetramitiformis TaxID=36881 RepID=A0AAE0GLR4_9CHLO|nr:hypothetical protein CYMTET_11733 [Cymbomonas tetramitiformis]
MANPVAQEMLDFINKSWTQFHATHEACKRFEANGFTRLTERQEWTLEPGGKYFVTRNQSAVVAFVVGKKFTTGSGFNVVAAHTDSPCPKLKPISASTKGGFLRVGVQTYGGGLWHTWFDRDLSVAGRVLVRRCGGAVISHELVRINRPIMRIPTLAIHLDRNVNSEGFKCNPESHLAPVLATQIKSALGEEEKSKDSKDGERHHAILINLLAKELGCAPEDICDFELNVCDTQDGVIGGAQNEFVYCGRLDNLCMSFCSMKALIEVASNAEKVAESASGWMCALFDNEEVGSNSVQGAGSPMMFEIMKRTTAILQDGPSEGAVERMLRNSFMVSADMAHCLHPNYMEKHEEKHQPKMHAGLVVKHNCNQRYATTSVTNFLFREVAVRKGIPIQDFVVRNDMGCGSTIGPILASGIGIRTVDVGVPQLSMHSIREMCGTEDVDIAYQHFCAFYYDFEALDATLAVDE